MDARILVVDDDPDIHTLLVATLREAGCRADCVSSGLEALARLQSENYDLVLGDVCMPGLDGLELLHRIQQQCPSIPVVVMTAQNTPESLIRSIRENAFANLSKPFSRKAVVDMVTRALERPAGGDDIEVLSARPDWIEFKLRCKMDTADRLFQFLREMQIGLSEAEQNNIAIAFRELLINAVEHGGHLDAEQKVEVSYIRLSQAVLYLVRDPGKGFSFENLRHAAVANAPGDPIGHVAVRTEAGLRPGGFDILLTRHIADELIYSEQGNEVILVKYTHAHPEG